jgi:hypothetical protein
MTSVSFGPRGTGRTTRMLKAAYEACRSNKHAVVVVAHSSFIEWCVAKMASGGKMKTVRRWMNCGLLKFAVAGASIDITKVTDAGDYLGHPWTQGKIFVDHHAVQDHIENLVPLLKKWDAVS